MQFHHQGHLGGYTIGEPDPASWYPEMWKWLINELDIRTMIDLGCGEGYTTEFFHNLGVRSVGVEGCEVNNPLVKQHDFTEGPYETWRWTRRFDLVWCCEVVEHIEEEFLPNLMETIQGAKYVAMTHAFPGQGGHHHVNCQTGLYWLAQFYRYGYELDERTEKARELASGHFARSGMLFTR